MFFQTTDLASPRKTCQQITQTDTDEPADSNPLDLTNHVIKELCSRLERTEQKVENLSRTNSGNLSIEHSAKRADLANKDHTVEKSKIHSSRPSTPVCDEILALRQRVTELQFDHDRLVKENERLTAKAEHSKVHSEKRKQNAPHPNPVYSTAPPIPICPILPSSLTNTMMSPLNLGFPNCLCIPQTPWTPTHCVMSKCLMNHDGCDTQENASPQKSVRQCSAPHASCGRPNNKPLRQTLSKTNYQSSWSLDQDEPEFEDNSHLVDLHCVDDNKPIFKGQGNERICEDLLEKLRPEIDRSITRHIEASDAERMSRNIFNTLSVADKLNPKESFEEICHSNTTSMILSNVERNLKNLEKRFKSHSKPPIDSDEYLDFLKSKYFV
ncbi:hypothetical protein PHET_04483 [Paragonimus heterotremus]|uniref:Uncharacterized protein n=1 Tax=Paragonimus heterotremus TaxID=100268 RepID=A0A8J4SQ68_9TREM|nr:hypothetical protein PHET_04483 [Paragonimus heterotremus]